MLYRNISLAQENISEHVWNTHKKNTHVRTGLFIPRREHKVSLCMFKMHSFLLVPQELCNIWGEGGGGWIRATLYKPTQKSDNPPHQRLYTCQTIAAGKYILCKKQTNNIS